MDVKAEISESVAEVQYVQYPKSESFTRVQKSTLAVIDTFIFLTEGRAWNSADSFSLRFYIQVQLGAIDSSLDY
jgi:hypothetical protein